MIPDDLADLKKVMGLALKVSLDTGSSTGQGKVMRGGKKISEADEYMENVAVCYMSKHDMAYMGLVDGNNVLLRSTVGSIALEARKAGCPPGIVFVPKGPWINSIIEAETSQSGSPHYKGMDVTLTLTDEKVKGVDEIIKSYGRR